MTGKCWKQTKYEKGHYNADYTVYEREGDRLSIWGLTNGKINPNKKATKNNIAVVWEVKGKKFKTKPKAISFAKKYMREHNKC